MCTSLLAKRNASRLSPDFWHRCSSQTTCSMTRVRASHLQNFRVLGQFSTHTQLLKLHCNFDVGPTQHCITVRENA